MISLETFLLSPFYYNLLKYATLLIQTKVELHYNYGILIVTKPKRYHASLLYPFFILASTKAFQTKICHTYPTHNASLISFPPF